VRLSIGGGQRARRTDAYGRTGAEDAQSIGCSATGGFWSLSRCDRPRASFGRAQINAPDYILLGRSSSESNDGSAKDGRMHVECAAAS